jgi:hypothetical protein
MRNTHLELTGGKTGTLNTGTGKQKQDGNPHEPSRGSR